MILLITVPLMLMIYEDAVWENKSMLMGPADFLINYIFPAIAVIMFWLYKSATPGKIILGLTVIDATTGNPLSVGQAIGRYFGYLVSMLGIFWIGWDKKKQGWHDKLSNTVVIRKLDRVDSVDFKVYNKS